MSVLPQYNGPDVAAPPGTSCMAFNMNLIRSFPVLKLDHYMAAIQDVISDCSPDERNEFLAVHTSEKDLNIVNGYFAPIRLAEHWHLKKKMERMNRRLAYSKQMIRMERVKTENLKNKFNQMLEPKTQEYLQLVVTQAKKLRLANVKKIKNLRHFQTEWFDVHNVLGFFHRIKQLRVQMEWSETEAYKTKLVYDPLLSKKVYVIITAPQSQELLTESSDAEISDVSF